MLSPFNLIGFQYATLFFSPPVRSALLNIKLFWNCSSDQFANSP